MRFIIFKSDSKKPEILPCRIHFSSLALDTFLGDFKNGQETNVTRARSYVHARVGDGGYYLRHAACLVHGSNKRQQQKKTGKALEKKVKGRIARPYSRPNLIQTARSDEKKIRWRFSL